MLLAWLAPYQSSGQLRLLTEYKPVDADVDGDQVRSVTVESLRTANRHTLTGAYFVDATELGDLLPLTNTEFVVGAESQAQTNELHATRGGKHGQPASLHDVLRDGLRCR